MIEKPGMTPYEQRMVDIAERDSRRWRRFRRLFWWPLIALLALIVIAFLIALINTTVG